MQNYKVDELFKCEVITYSIYICYIFIVHAVFLFAGTMYSMYTCFIFIRMYILQNIITICINFLNFETPR